MHTCADAHLHTTRPVAPRGRSLRGDLTASPTDPEVAKLRPAGVNHPGASPASLVASPEKLADFGQVFEDVGSGAWYFGVLSQSLVERIRRIPVD